MDILTELKKAGGAFRGKVLSINEATKHRIQKQKTLLDAIASIQDTKVQFHSIEDTFGSVSDNDIPCVAEYWLYDIKDSIDDRTALYLVHGSRGDNFASPDYDVAMGYITSQRTDQEGLLVSDKKDPQLREYSYSIYTKAFVGFTGFFAAASFLPYLVFNNPSLLTTGIATFSLLEIPSTLLYLREMKINKNAINYIRGNITARVKEYGRYTKAFSKNKYSKDSLYGIERIMEHYDLNSLISFNN